MIFIFIGFVGQVKGIEYDDNTLRKASEQPRWHMLLHDLNHRYFIKDPKFYFYSKSRNSFKELKATLDAFQLKAPLNNEHPLCRFPARYLWLKKTLKLNDANFPRPNCQNYRTFQAKVPLDDVQLVFASENIVSPSSMMGHVFFKLSGVNKDNKHVAHAVTYFTVLDSFNVPKIIYQNFFGGMSGIFALQPYQDLKHNYLDKEERNLWEYQLNLTPYQKQLLSAHIWELKGVKSDYLFVKYNCATITYILMALIFPDVLKEKKHWLTPIDIVKIANQQHIIQGIHVFTSDRWKISMLLDQFEGLNEFQKKIDTLTEASLPKLMNHLKPQALLFAQAYLPYLNIHHHAQFLLKKELFESLQQSLSKQSKAYILDYSNYKDPLQAPNNSQLDLSWGRSAKGGFMGISFLPAANRITDDQRQFFSSRELRIGDIEARLYANRHLKLQRMTLYAVRNMNPWAYWNHAVSGQWKLGLEQHYNNVLQEKLVLNLSGGLGYSLNLSDDVRVALLYNVGVAGNLQKKYAYHGSNILLEVDEIADLKLTAEYEGWFRMYGANARVDKAKLCESYYPKSNTTWLACYEHISNKAYVTQNYQLLWQKHF